MKELSIFSAVEATLGITKKMFYCKCLLKLVTTLFTSRHIMNVLTEAFTLKKLQEVSSYSHLQRINLDKYGLRETI